MVISQLQIVLASLCGLGVLAVAVQLLRNRLVNRPILVLLGLIETGLVVHLVVGLARVLRSAPADVAVGTYVGYLAVSVLILPLAVGWSWAERSRGGTATVLAGLVVVPYLFVRLYQIWPGQ